jgi:hypothetical protein
MGLWHVLIWGLVAVGILAALFGLHRLCLWLEDRGLLYYRKKKPTSSGGITWLVMQEFLEPQVQHVLSVTQKHAVADKEAVKERLFAQLFALLDSIPVNQEEVRCHLTEAKRARLDWKRLYEEVVRAHLSARPDRARHLPPLEKVAPPE